MKVIEVQRDELDTQALAQMERVEQLNKRLADFDTVLTERSRLCDAAKAESAERHRDTAERLSELERERAAAAAGVPAEAMALFDEVADLHEGEALSEVQVISARHRECAALATSRVSKGTPHGAPRSPRHRRVDTLFCERLINRPERLAQMAMDVFANNPGDRVMRFMHEQTSRSEEFALLRSLPMCVRIRAAFKALVH
jgi:hypothetical protein